MDCMLPSSQLSHRIIRCSYACRTLFRTSTYGRHSQVHCKHRLIIHNVRTDTIQAAQSRSRVTKIAIFTNRASQPAIVHNYGLIWHNGEIIAVYLDGPRMNRFTLLLVCLFVLEDTLGENPSCVCVCFLWTGKDLVGDMGGSTQGKRPLVWAPVLSIS